MVLENDEGFTDITSFLAVGKADTHRGPTMRQLKEEHGIEVVLDLNDKKSEAKIEGSNVLYEKYNYGYIRYVLPKNPPEFYDLSRHE